MPHSGAPKARGSTATAPTERSSMLSRCASSSDTVREINYQILQLKFEDFLVYPLDLVGGYDLAVEDSWLIDVAPPLSHGAITRE
jgi:hypothetical protein